MMAKCANCLHRDVCKSCESCDGHVPGCRHFVERRNAETGAVGDIIRALTDEELAQKLFELYRDIHDGKDIAVNWCDACGGCEAASGEELDCTDMMHIACILRWLRKTVEGGDVQSL